MQLVGIKSMKMSSGKNAGKTAYSYYLTKDFTDYERTSGECKGVSVTQEFSYTDFGIAVGEYVTPIYEKGYQDKAVLVNLVPFKPSEKK